MSLAPARSLSVSIIVRNELVGAVLGGASRKGSSLKAKLFEEAPGSEQLAGKPAGGAVLVLKP